MMLVALTVTVLASLLYSLLRRRAKGKLGIQSSAMLYDKQRYGHILNYNQYSLIIHGQPTMILSGEFHYWRLPDRDRWESVLRQYRAAGLNCIRIYFHWGFHSPAEGLYDFTGNRDIDYLLTLCESIGLYVLAAPGPYICAETQGGGFPVWLIAKRDIRLRHLKTNFWKVYDAEFMRYCEQYFEHILPILAHHQITQDDGKTGCILGLQLENESFQTLFGYPLGLHDDMGALAHYARKYGITVPFFTNDGWEQGSFIVKEGIKYKHDFGLDLYGFDKYVVFTPNSEPSSWLIKRDQTKMPDWEPSTVTAGLDGMERKVRSFGHAAAQTPIFIPELQGGWFNHYGLSYTYDTIYNFYGDQYTKMLLDTVTSQGCTTVNYYMFYGGTNWGTIGDADVYTSYDYSACIREYGFMSGRCRKLRLGLLFLHSFNDITSQTEATNKKQWTVTADLGNVVCQQRICMPSCRSTSDNAFQSSSSSSSKAELTYLRNFAKCKSPYFQLIALSRSNITHRSEVVRLECYLPYKASFTALGNYTLPKNHEIQLILSAAPIYIRSWVGNREVWIVGMAESGPTELAFYGVVSVLAHGGDIEVRMDLVGSDGDRYVQRLSVQGRGSQGYVLITNRGGTPDNGLHIVFLDHSASRTLYAHFDNNHYAHADIHRTQSVFGPSTPKLVAWGAYSTYYDTQKRALEVDALERDHALHVIAFDQDLHTLVHDAHGNDDNDNNSLGDGLPYGVRALHYGPVQASQATESARRFAPSVRDPSLAGLPFTGPWESRPVDFLNNSFDWIPCPKKLNSDEFEKVALDYKFTSGHVIYRGRFQTVAVNPSADKMAASTKVIQLKINMRHRVTAYVNGVSIGSHMVYSRQLLMPGAKVGPDPSIFGLGSHTFTIPSEVLALKTATSSLSSPPPPTPGTNGLVEHEIILVIDSVGLSRGPFVVNDFRNPRGLLSAKVIGPAGLVVRGSEHWHVAGVDVTKLANPYGSTGFPDEHVQEGWTLHTSGGPCLDPRKGVTWWRAQFEGPPRDVLLSAPSNSSLSEKTRLVIPFRLHIEGEFSAMILLNRTLIGRYFGSDSPQHDYYLMDGLVHYREDEDGRVGLTNELQLLIYGSQTIESIQVQILPWVVQLDGSPEHADWSGNLVSSVASDNADQGVPFFTIRHNISV